MPSSPTTVRVRHRGAFVEIVAGNVVLLSSAALQTERTFGSLSTEVLGRAPSRVLIGGLGFGATLRGVLDVTSSKAQIVVAEKVEEVIALVRGDLAYLAGRPLDDPRAKIEVADVHDVMTRARASFDVILLDVDNGPHWASFRSNARLYTPSGLAVARAALAPGGMLAVWSGYRFDRFLASLRAAGFTPSSRPLKERGRICARAYIGLRPEPRAR